MGREGWLYVLAFVAILGAGALLIVPRLRELASDPASVAPTPPALPPDVAPDEPAPPASRPWVRVRIEGPRGVLKGPLKPILGAEVERLGDPEEPVGRVRLRATADVIHVGAGGHLWRALDPDALANGDVVVLEEAAAPVVIRVREANGRPAPDVPVLVQRESPGPVPRSDRGGTVVLDDLAPGLVVMAVGGRERRGPVLRLLAGRDGDRTAVLEPAWEVTGRVVDERGRHPEGVVVVGLARGGVTGVTTSTDADGRFTWRGPVTSTLALRLTQTGRAVAQVEAVPPGRGALVTDLGDVLLRRPVSELTGRVLATSGDVRPTVAVEPAVAAILRELFGHGAALDAPLTTTCAEDGSFRMPDVPSGIPLRVSIRGGGLPVDDVVTATPGSFELQTYTPPPGHVLEGHVHDAVAGRSAANVHVLLSSGPRDGRRRRDDVEAVTDGAGRFRVRGLPRGPVFLRAYVEDRRALVAETAVPRADPLRLELRAPSDDPDRVLEGVVVDELNVPLAGVSVEAAGRATVTGADGRFRLADVAGASDAVLVVARHRPGAATTGDPTPFVTGVRRLATPGEEALKLVLARSAGVTFRAVDGLDDEPLSFVHALLRSDDGEVLYDRALSLRNGIATLDGLLPRGGTLALFSDRHRAIRAVILEAGRTTDLGTIRLARGMHVTGRVVDGEGRPVPGARLGGVESGWLHLRGGDPTAERELELRRTVADDEGRFVFDGFDPKEPAVLAVWAPGYAPAARRVVLEKFQDDVHLDVTVKMQRGGWLAVELKESGTDRRVSGAVFDLEDARNGSHYLDLLRRGMLGGPVGSDEDWRLASEHFLFEREEGRYRLGPVEPGPYEVWVERRGYGVLRKRLTVIDPTGALVGVAGAKTRSLIDSPHLLWELVPE